MIFFPKKEIKRLTAQYMVQTLLRNTNFPSKSWFLRKYNVNVMMARRFSQNDINSFRRAKHKLL